MKKEGEAGFREYLMRGLGVLMCVIGLMFTLYHVPDILDFVYVYVPWSNEQPVDELKSEIQYCAMDEHTTSLIPTGVGYLISTSTPWTVEDMKACLAQL